MTPGHNQDYVRGGGEFVRVQSSIGRQLGRKSLGRLRWRTASYVQYTKFELCTRMEQQILFSPEGTTTDWQEPVSFASNILVCNSAHMRASSWQSSACVLSFSSMCAIAFKNDFVEMFSGQLGEWLPNTVRTISGALEPSGRWPWPPNPSLYSSRVVGETGNPELKRTHKANIPKIQHSRRTMLVEFGSVHHIFVVRKRLGAVRNSTVQDLVSSTPNLFHSRRNYEFYSGVHSSSVLRRAPGTTI